MSKLRLLALSPLIFFFVACDGNTLEPDGRMGPGSASSEIFDATQTTAAIGFWWLPSLVPQPTLSGTFQPNLDPMIRVICYKTTQGVQNCDGSENATIAQFTVGGGVLVEENHYKVEFDTKAYNLTVSESSDVYTTYRIIAYTSPLTEQFGGPYALGWADIQIAANGAAATNLDIPGDLIALVDNRTLPVRFFLNEDAYPYVFANADVGDRYCEINCSFTLIEPDATTIAELLSLDKPGGQYAALEFRPGHVDATTLLVLDERDPENCAEVGLEQMNCVRAELSPAPTKEFAADGDEEGVRMGLRRCDVPLGHDTPWTIGKYNEVEGLDKQLVETDVSDFFNDNCDWPQWTFLGLEVGRFARAIADFLVRPAYAGDLQDAGVTIRTLSDVFWVKDAELRAVSPLTVFGTVTPGIEHITVQVVNVHSHHEPPPGLEGMEVVFTVTGGAGSLLSNGDPVGHLALLTDANGQISVQWALAEGVNELSVNAPLALSAPEPLVFIRNAAIGEQAGSGLSFSVELGYYALKHGVDYVATITNANSTAESGLTIHGWVQNPDARAGGHANNQCNTVAAATTDGAGECTTLTRTLSTSSLDAGPATAVFQLRRGGTLLAEVRKEIVLQLP